MGGPYSKINKFFCKVRLIPQILRIQAQYTYAYVSAAVMWLK